MKEKRLLITKLKETSTKERFFLRSLVFFCLRKTTRDCLLEPATETLKGLSPLMFWSFGVGKGTHTTCVSFLCK